MLTFALVAILFVAVHAQKWDLPPPNSDLNIFALPVGQGDSTIIQCPAQYGGFVTVVDSGSCKSTNYMSAQNVSDTLKGHTIERIFLSHPDKDHINYVDAIVKGRNPYPKIYHSCKWKTTTYGKYIKTKLPREQINYCCGITQCPQYAICNQKVNIYILASERAKCNGDNSNGDSLVLQVEYGGTTVYLPGDFEGDSDFIDDFISCSGNLESNAYRLAHYGAYNQEANTPKLLNKIRPRYAFSSSGLHNGYIHPRCEVHYQLETSNVSRLDKNVASHMYTCSTSTNEWDNRMITDGIYVTTVIDPDPNIDKAHNFVIHFAVNANGVTPPGMILVNSFPYSNVFKRKHQMLHQSMHYQDKNEDADECGAT